MARQLREGSSLVIEMAEQAGELVPTSCVCQYEVADGTLTEGASLHPEMAPDFNQQTDVLCAAVIEAVKTGEGL